MLLTNLKRLQHLTLSVVESFSNDAISVLGGITTLRSLSFHKLEVDKGWMMNTASLINLRELILQSSTKPVSRECFNIICESFIGLEVLWLEKCELLTDEEGKKLCLFKRLKNVTLDSAHGFTDVTFEKGLGSPSLAYLRVSSC